jgi:[ribosomal protein S5]-alanine N-acetyltransferase
MRDFFMTGTLETTRFLLQDILPEDQGFIFEGLSDPAVIPYYGVRYESFEQTKAQMDFYIYLQQSGTGKWWKIVERETGEKMGAIGFNNYNQQHQKAELGYWLLPCYWHKGIVSEVMPSVIQYLFRVVQVHRIEALVEEGNHTSNKVLERAGFHFEGCMRDTEIKNGAFISLRMYSLLQTDIVI